MKKQIRNCMHVIFGLSLILAFVHTHAQPDTWKEKKAIGNQGPIPTDGSKGFAVGTKGYVLSFNSFAPSGKKVELWEYDPLQDKWKMKSVFPGFANADVV